MDMQTDPVKAKEEIADLLKQGYRVPVQRYVLIKMLYGEGDVRLLTEGMWDYFQLPELELKAVRPRFLAKAAGALLNSICQFMVDGIPQKYQVQAGENLQLDPLTVVRFKKVESLAPLEEDPTYLLTPRFEVVEEPRLYNCEHHECHHGPTPIPKASA